MSILTLAKWLLKVPANLGGLIMVKLSLVIAVGIVRSESLKEITLLISMYSPGVSCCL